MGRTAADRQHGLWARALPTIPKTTRDAADRRFDVPPGIPFNGLFVDLSTRIRGSWSSCNPMKIGVFLSFARSISRFCGGRLRGPRSWMGGLLGGVHA